jgi:hypothetical protein
MLGEDTIVEDYVVNVMGCTRLFTPNSSSTIREYVVFDGLQMRLRYHYPIGMNSPMFIGSVEWLYLGHPPKKELFNSDMPAVALCRYLVMRVLDYSFK